MSILSAEEQLPSGFPTIDMGPQLKVVEKARTATMLCAAGGNPDPEISWFKDFLPVDPTASNGRIKQLRSGEQSSRPKRPPDLTRGILPEPCPSEALVSGGFPLDPWARHLAPGQGGARPENLLLCWGCQT